MGKRLLFIALLIVFACEEKDKTSNVIYSSIEDGDNVSTNGGLIIQFSESMDLNIFEADTIITSVAGRIDPISGESVTFALSNIIIQNSAYITMNNEPQTFYCNSSTFTCAFIQPTSAENTEGTGEGFIIQEGDNEFKIGDEYLVNFTGNNVNIVVNTWPNPYQYEHPNENEELNEHFLTFTHLPETTGCIITIYTHLGEEIRIIEHNSGTQYSI